MVGSGARAVRDLRRLGRGLRGSDVEGVRPLGVFATHGIHERAERHDAEPFGTSIGHQFFYQTPSCTSARQSLWHLGVVRYDLGRPQPGIGQLGRMPINGERVSALAALFRVGDLRIRQEWLVLRRADRLRLPHRHIPQS